MKHPFVLLFAFISAMGFAQEKHCFQKNGKEVCRITTYSTLKEPFSIVYKREIPDKYKSTTYYTIAGKIKDSCYTYFDPFGCVLYSGEYDSGKMTGIKTTYYCHTTTEKQGTVRHIQSYKNDKKHGLSMEWDSCGNLLKKGRYYKGIKTGTFKSRYPNGNVKRIRHYKTNLTLYDRLLADSLSCGIKLRTGTWKGRHPNGQLAYMKQFKNYGLDGYRRRWDSSGNLVEKDYFKYDFPADPTKNYPDSDTGLAGRYIMVPSPEKKSDMWIFNICSRAVVYRDSIVKYFSDHGYQRYERNFGFTKMRPRSVLYKNVSMDTIIHRTKIEGDRVLITNDSGNSLGSGLREVKPNVLVPLDNVKKYDPSRPLKHYPFVYYKVVNSHE